MNYLIADDQTAAGFIRLKELTEIRTLDGQLVGFLVPASVRKARMWAEATDHVDIVNLLNGKTSHQLGATTRQMFERILRQAPDERGTDDLREHIARLKHEETSETLDLEPPPDADPPFEVDGSR